MLFLFHSVDHVSCLYVCFVRVFVPEETSASANLSLSLSAAGEAAPIANDNKSISEVNRTKSAEQSEGNFQALTGDFLGAGSLFSRNPVQTCRQEKKVPRTRFSVVSK